MTGKFKGTGNQYKLVGQDSGLKTVRYQQVPTFPHRVTLDPTDAGQTSEVGGECVVHIGRQKIKS